ncbi:MAG: hypothetical protein J5843_01675 [Clostridia bacterium]|nr:hypothetical protein [Clostridia bacterium]
MYVFPKRFAGDDCLKYVFPSMQKQVQKVIDNAKSDSRVGRVRVFGSALTLNCGIGSDLDIAVDAPDIESDEDFLSVFQSIKKGLDVDCDVIHYNRIQNSLLKEEIDKYALTSICTRKTADPAEGCGLEGIRQQKVGVSR